MELTSAEQVYHVTRICVDSYEKQVPTGWRKRSPFTG